MKNIWEELNDEWLEENVSGDLEYALHHVDTCKCDNGKVGKKKRELANQKRKDFYKTARGLEIKNRFKKRAIEKQEVLEKVKQLKPNTSLGAMEIETIIKILSRVK